MATDELEGLLPRHEAFWRREKGTLLKRVTEHSPLGANRGIPLADGTRAAEGQFITPELIDPRRFYGEDGGSRSAVSGDFIAGAGPPHLCWTEAILGCPVRVVTGGPWAEPFFADWADLGGLAPDERWLEKLDGFVDFLSARAQGRYPVVQPLMRGPVDMMASAVGHERMCVALMEEPEPVKAFLEVCAGFFIRTAERRLERTPKFAGGYLSGYGIWAPGKVVRTQVDNATMLSPAVYGERVLRHDRRIIESFDFPLIHLHSGCLHVVDNLLEVEALKAVQVSIDYPGGPLAAKVQPILERIVRKKALIVTGPMTEAELGPLEALASQGSLCVHAQLVQDGAA